MKKILATDEYTIYQRRDSRHAIVGADKKYINGADKIAILIEHKIPPFDELKMPVPAPRQKNQMILRVVLRIKTSQKKRVPKKLRWKQKRTMSKQNLKVLMQLKT